MTSFCCIYNFNEKYFLNNKKIFTDNKVKQQKKLNNYSKDE